MSCLMLNGTSKQIFFTVISKEGQVEGVWYGIDLKIYTMLQLWLVLQALRQQEGILARK